MQNQVESLLKEQVGKEIYSAYLYLAIANYYAGENLGGFSHWFEFQAKEEMEHAMKILHYLQDNGVQVPLGAIDAPKADFKDHGAPLKAALAHEKFVTASIEAICKAANAADDFRTRQFLDWFVAEQAEEEKSAGDLVAKYEVLGGDPRGEYMLDMEMGRRAG